MARALGEYDRDKTRHCCAVAVWSALGGAVVYAVLLALCQRPLLAVIGGASSNLDYAVSYTTITMIVGAIPTILCLRHGWQRGVYAAHPKWLKGQGGTLGEVFRSGLSSFLMVALNSVSNSFLNASVGAYGSSTALSGLGIVRKIDGLAYSVNQASPRASCCPAWLLLYGREIVGHQPGCRQHHPVFVDLYPCLPAVGKTLGGLLPQRANTVAYAPPSCASSP